MIKGRISSLESMSTMDGPGVRFVVFMQGCHLRCVYCHNPETWALKGGQILLSPKELVNKILSCKPYFGEEGGVTFSGGEPLLQPEFLLETLKLCKANKIHTAVDTAGVGLGDYEKILEFVDLVILDIKATDEAEYRQITGKDMSEFKRFLNACVKCGNKLWIRQVIVPNINDDAEHIEKLNHFLKDLNNIERVELLPYKTLGKTKYESLGIIYRLMDTPEMDEAKCNELEKSVCYLKSNI